MNSKISTNTYTGFVCNEATGVLNLNGGKLKLCVWDAESVDYFALHNREGQINLNGMDIDVEVVRQTQGVSGHIKVVRSKGGKITMCGGSVLASVNRGKNISAVCVDNDGDWNFTGGHIVVYGDEKADGVLIQSGRDGVMSGIVVTAETEQDDANAIYRASTSTMKLNNVVATAASRAGAAYAIRNTKEGSINISGGRYTGSKKAILNYNATVTHNGAEFIPTFD